VPIEAVAEGEGGASTGTLDGDADAGAPFVALGVREGEREATFVPVGEFVGVAPQLRVVVADEVVVAAAEAERVAEVELVAVGVAEGEVDVDGELVAVGVADCEGDADAEPLEDVG
jgi:hypothetical protein